MRQLKYLNLSTMLTIAIRIVRISVSNMAFKKK